MRRLLRQAPNILSALRLIAAPVTAILILHGADLAALCVFAFAGMSDALDGFLARRFALTSRFGAWLDPAADKLLMLSSFVTLALAGAAPVWLAALVIGRDAAIVLGIALARALDAPLQIAPLLVGKASTVVQVIYVVFILLLLVANFTMPRLELAGAATVALFTAWSFAAYGFVWLQAVTAGRRRAA